jgi:hypothetical protein
MTNTIHRPPVPDPQNLHQPMASSTASMDVKPLAPLLRDALEEIVKGPVEVWWRNLTVTDREHIAELWNSCADQHFGSGRAEDLPMEARVVAIADDPAGDTFEGYWHRDYYEYLVNHEAYFVTRTFHVCTAEAAARAAVQQGKIPADYACPLVKRSCPMRRALAQAGGQPLRLSLTFWPRARGTSAKEGKIR